MGHDHNLNSEVDVGVNVFLVTTWELNVNLLFHTTKYFDHHVQSGRPTITRLLIRPMMFITGREMVKDFQSEAYENGMQR